MAEEINCPAPLPEDQEFPLLEKMLFPAPYEVPEKMAKKATQGPRRAFTGEALRTRRPEARLLLRPLTTAMKRKKKMTPHLKQGGRRERPP